MIIYVYYNILYCLYVYSELVMCALSVASIVSCIGTHESGTKTSILSLEVSLLLKFSTIVLVFLFFFFFFFGVRVRENDCLALVVITSQRVRILKMMLSCPFSMMKVIPYALQRGRCIKTR